MNQEHIKHMFLYMLSKVLYTSIIFEVKTYNKDITIEILTSFAKEFMRKSPRITIIRIKPMLT